DVLRGVAVPRLVLERVARRRDQDSLAERLALLKVVEHGDAANEHGATRVWQLPRQVGVRHDDGVEAGGMVAPVPLVRDAVPNVDAVLVDGVLEVRAAVRVLVDSALSRL